ncbi:hypothetical protein PPTG_20052 [Phytophthora nicotianae INRA-310]|uniref:Uncharacterized protein n=1 Tax=Phytophthora nicotianae (strain INRA-310) TaxID=761204 RepID=W2P9T6_PHYN3|nr:hypothetical protein PPTG_20052 [Phytophthora nicotianae INRA-310]ETM97777.1 hypothetical protein PPTG_20052 [Phytophthora nicotianae INRA-310]
MVNAFIVHKLVMKQRNKPVSTHAAFMRRFHADLRSQTKEDFTDGDDLEDLVAEPLPQLAHTLEKTEETNGVKRRQWLCKVRRLDRGNQLTCSQIWHQTWKNGTAIPAALQHKSRFVKKRRVEVDSDASEE